ncbi:heparan-alpha-glucosaminide N-acetyltransferase domain-containing protein [Microbacterium sp. PA5]|uniref:heparan-alpha-glucosaminide N-acetyltransferase domain-containing protein n=1 Tax=Microbacterium sp. PA5 TaxID=3416654 RepID=UPI003CF7EC9D
MTVAGALATSHLQTGSRLAGVDLARGLAVLGMLTAHLLAIEAFDPSAPATWVDIVNGRSSILFAVLAGVSLALVSGGAAPVAGDRLRLVRARTAVRAVVLWTIGILLILTGVPVYVILPAYAVLFLLALPFLRLRAPALWLLAAALALTMPLLQPALNEIVARAGSDVELMLGWHYPFTLWLAFVLAGLAAGRSDLRRLRTQLALVAVGVAAAVVGYGAVALWPVADGPAWVGEVWTDRAHSGGLPEVLGSGGVALAVLGASLLVCRTPLAWVLIPLRAVGSMPLTAYVGQLLAWAVIAAVVLGDTGDLGGFRALDPLGPFIVTTLVACTAWALLFGRGPLERGVAWIVRTLVRG